jgi:D-3-phosphoglycerate dehydrogenase / 2-oxoglutarate reductase
VPRFKIVVADSVASDTLLEERVLGDAGIEADLLFLKTLDTAEIALQAADADALILVYARIDRSVIVRLERCRVISRYGVGVDMIDVAAARERGIPVCNVPDYCVSEVSAHTLACLLSLNRKLMPQTQYVREGGWYTPPVDPPARLQGQILGLVGLGRIGQAVARGAQGLGLRVLAFDPYTSTEQAGKSGVEPVELGELLRQADYISIHCPLNPQTHHLIGREQLELMKPSVFLINVARGPLVDQAALCEALTARRIAGAALDVFEHEPPDTGDALFHLDNVILTPHRAYWSVQSAIDIRQGAIGNVVAVLQGGAARNVVGG